jgi:hypothetical protein
MPAAPLVVTALLVSSTVLGTLGVAFGDWLAPGPAVVAVVGMVILTLVAASGTLLARGRWAGPTDAAIAATWMGAAVAAPMNGLGWATLGVAGAALAAVTGPWLRGWLRHRPRADGPPPVAVLLLLALLATPPAIAFASAGGLPIAALVLCAWSPLLALSLARIAPGALAGVRVIHPALSVAAAVSLGLPAGAVAVGLGTAVTVLGWRRDLALAIAPAVPIRGEAYAIPPELAPREVLEAAGLDEHGRPRRDP